MSDYCIQALKKTFEEMRTKDEFASISDRDLQDIATVIDNIKHLAEKDGVDFKKRAMDALDGLRREFVNAEAKKKTQAVREKAVLRRLHAVEGKEGESLVSMIVGGSDTGDKAGLSVAMTSESRAGQWGQGFESDLMPLGDTAKREIIKGNLDRETFAEVVRLKDPESLIPESKNQVVRDYARAVVRTTDALKKQIEHSLGHPIGNLTDWIQKRTHNEYKINKAGFKQWSNDILASLDRDKTYGAQASNNEFILGELEKDYERFIGGTSQDSKKGRTYQFKGPDAEFSYNQKYGEHNLYESVHALIERTAKDSSLMDTFGPDYKRGFEKALAVVTDLENYDAKKLNLKDVNLKSDIEKLKVWKAWENSSVARSGFDDLTGKTSVGGKLYGATTMVKGALNLALLENTGFRAFFQNLASSAMAMRAMTGDHPFVSMYKVMQSNFEFIKDRSIARDAGIAMQDISNEMMFELQAGDKRPGRIASKIIAAHEYAEAKGFDWIADRTRQVKAVTMQKGLIPGANSAFFEMNGLTGTNRIYAGGTARLVMKEFANVANKDFGELASHTRVTFERMGITEKHWDVMRFGVDETPNGMQFLSAQKIASTPDGLITSMTGIKDPKKIHAFRMEMADGYGSIINNAAVHFATTTPNARTRAIIGFGIPTDKWQASATALAMQYKSFVVYQSQMVKELMNVEGAAAALEGHGKVGQGYARGKVLGAYMTSAAALWYASEQTINTLKGRAVENNMLGTPGMPDEIAQSVQNPLMGDTLMRSYIKSGVLGMAADMVDASFSGDATEGILKYAAGPALSFGAVAGSIGANAIRGKKVGKQAAALTSNLMPGADFALTARFVKPYIVDPLLTQISPEYVQKQELRQMMRQSGLQNPIEE